MRQNSVKKIIKKYLLEKYLLVLVIWFTNLISDVPYYVPTIEFSEIKWLNQRMEKRFWNKIKKGVKQIIIKAKRTWDKKKREFVKR